MPETYKVAIIGSTGRGGYGHGLDTVFKDLDNVELVAVADGNPEGLIKAGDRLGVSHLYDDYRKMLATEKPDLVSITPGWVSERVQMIETAASVGSHIYCEKPVAGSLAEIDTIINACSRGNIKMAIAHQWRAMPPIQQAIADVMSGKFGKLLRIWARPKDDSRGGGEELLLHGTHLFDLMMAFTNIPRWVSGHVLQNGRDSTQADTHYGTQPVGPIIGDSISATFGFDNGVRGFFESTANLAIPGQSNFNNLFGMSIECEQARLELREPGDCYIYPAPRVLPDQEHLAWEKVWIEGWHDKYDHNTLWKNFLHLGNQILVKDLIETIETEREPLSSICMARYVNEMVQGVYLSHLSDGRRIDIPLADRTHPLGPSE
ncbi:TPA: Gfo/Idh/MocA family oxidoreductase [Candidatus Poribacteria bacterium]|nr:Gfo/Idh/MocA family oxidoreductase [Candidatus Poribacteria bacterium]HIC00702.1 Gfo/Idh/MocA family oxidoreductase [Candidatus Poribacteria bacterium]HIO50577.1 Gfo/Idh/MocA family oxidoreductase [Candidatus Poribacteria bacterium]